MILFVSDVHFGAHDRATDRAIERDLIACLDAHAKASELEHLYIVGDLYDAYVEYSHLLPKGLARLHGWLARWTDAGRPVTYLLGNHDPWHRDYFETELGVRVCPEPIDVCHYDQHIHLAHGDGVASTHGLFPSVRSWMRHPIPVWLYRTLLPADAGQRMAAWISEAVRKSHTDPDVIAGLHDYARQVLTSSDADGVVMGHSHRAALHDGPDGVYLNTGHWAQERTFGRLDADGWALQRWNGTEAVNIQTDRA